MAETTVLGAAMAAGKGVGLWTDLNSLNTSEIEKISPSDMSHDGEKQ